LYLYDLCNFSELVFRKKLFATIRLNGAFSVRTLVSPSSSVVKIKPYAFNLLRICFITCGSQIFELSSLRKMFEFTACVNVRSGSRYRFTPCHIQSLLNSTIHGSKLVRSAVIHDYYCKCLWQNGIIRVLCVCQHSLWVIRWFQVWNDYNV
jgi:hypothetical protein